MAQPQPLAVRAKPGVAPGRSPLGRGGPGRRDEAEPSLEVGAPPGPHLPLVAACVPLSHVAPGTAGRPPPAQVRSAGAGRCGSERSAGCSETRPGTATPPRRAARLCFRVAGQVEQGAAGARVSSRQPLPTSSAGPRNAVPPKQRQESACNLLLKLAAAGSFCLPTAPSVPSNPPGDWRVGFTAASQEGTHRSAQPKTHLCILSRVVFCFTCFKMFFFDLSKGKFNFPKTTEQEKAEGNFENLLKNLAFAVVL